MCEVRVTHWGARVWTLLWVCSCVAWQVLDGRPYNHKADVYSFGVCLWEIYCCDMPYPSLSLKDMAAVVNNVRPSLACPGGVWVQE